MLTIRDNDSYNYKKRDSIDRSKSNYDSNRYSKDVCYSGGGGGGGGRERDMASAKGDIVEINIMMGLKMIITITDRDFIGRFMKLNIQVYA